MILIALGANLPGPAGPPLAQCEAALVALASAGIAVRRRSRWYETAPVPASDQPWYVNGVAVVETTLGPVDLLAVLHRIEAQLGRRRTVANAARTLDLDLLDYDGLVRPGPEPPILPHPRMEGRGFVLRPLAEVAPTWRHPVSGRSIAELVAALSDGAGTRPMTAGAAGPHVGLNQEPD
jgi:2-amino-4-hydroxy-6-hydroxymethyldihydropteridine diphosphokinase